MPTRDVERCPGLPCTIPQIACGAPVTVEVRGASSKGERPPPQARVAISLRNPSGNRKCTLEEQRAWIFSVLIFEDGAAKAFAKFAGELGKGLGKTATAKIPMTTLRAFNRAAGRTLVTKYGTKRGAVALGRALPFDIGAAVGGGANYLFANLTAKHANKFFKNLPYESVVIDSEGVEGTPA